MCSGIRLARFIPGHPTRVPEDFKRLASLLAATDLVCRAAHSDCGTRARLFPRWSANVCCGRQPSAALLTGIAVDWTIIAAFTTSAIICGLGGIIIASRLASAQPELGPSFLLPAFASAFLGATTIRPGRYNAIGTVVAVYVIAVIVAGLQQIGVPFWAEHVVYGVALAGGVALSTHLTRLREERARRDQLKAFEESREMTREISSPRAGLLSE